MPICLTPYLNTHLSQQKKKRNKTWYFKKGLASTYKPQYLAIVQSIWYYERATRSECEWVSIHFYDIFRIGEIVKVWLTICLVYIITWFYSFRQHKDCSCESLYKTLVVTDMQFKLWHFRCTIVLWHTKMNVLFLLFMKIAY